jgi:hypothetical protein
MEQGHNELVTLSWSRKDEASRWNLNCGLHKHARCQGDGWIDQGMNGLMIHWLAVSPELGPGKVLRRTERPTSTLGKKKKACKPEIARLRQSGATQKLCNSAALIGRRGA